MENIFTRLLSGETVSFFDPDYHFIPEACAESKKILVRLNTTGDATEAKELLHQLFGDRLHETAMITTPLHTNYGRNLSIGAYTFINHDCSFLDLGGISIDESVMIAPKVTISSEGHPVNVAERQSLSVGHVHICKNVWIGAGAVITAGVTIGENSVVAAGAVVTKDVPANVVVAGVPAKVIKELTN
ncbi:nodulation protein L [Capnocytophaga sp. HP1101]